jgi:ABC-type lipoprotein release transport system permease subunit
MGLIWLRGQAELRAKWRAVLLLVLVVGVGGGVTLTAIAGARRTDSAISRFVAYSLPDDGGFLFGSVLSPPVTSGTSANPLVLSPVERRIVDLPQVSAYFQAPYLFLTTDPTGRNIATLNAIGATTASLYRSVDRPLVVAGHLPSPTHPFDVAINELAAAARHLGVGSHLRLYAYSKAQLPHGGLTRILAGPQAPMGPSFRVRVVAIVRFPQDVNAVLPLAAKEGVSYENQENLYLTPAFLPRLAVGLGIPVQQVPDINLFGVRLRNGAADSKAFAAGAAALGHGQVFASAGNVFGIRSAAASAQHGIHLEVVALLLFGALAALVTLLLVGQTLARQVALEADDYEVLRSLGSTRAQLIAVVVLRGTVIGIAGGLLAIGVAVLASPVMPVGLARQAEISPGFNGDFAVLALGFLAVVVLMAACSAVPAWRIGKWTKASLNMRGGVSHRSHVAEAVARTRLSPTVAIGVRFALEPGRGRRSTPVASAMIGAVAAVAALAAALTFGASLQHLLSSPSQQGWNWDVLVGNPHNLTDQEVKAGSLLAHNRYVGSYSAIAILAGASQGNAVIDGEVVDLLLAFDPLKGGVYPSLIEGHAPRAADQIVLASRTLRELHRQIGQSVRINGPQGQSFTLRIVGRMISPSVGDLFTNNMGEGGWVYGPAIRRQQAQTTQNSDGPPPTVFNLFAVRYANGVSPNGAFASLQREFGRTVLRQLPSADVINLQSVDRLPILLAALVVLLGVATVGSALVASVRQRRRDLEILKTLGFVRRQLAAVIAWQATVFSLVALCVGLPVGIAFGRWSWSLVVPSIGSGSGPFVPTLAIVAVVPATLLVANVIAAVPGWAAAHLAPGVVMRSE